MSYYHGLITSKRAETILNRIPAQGSFLLRDSQSQPGNFVLSIKYDGKIYHVLVFHELGQYFLDSSGSSTGDSERFSSLEELVLFGISHELRVAGEEVMLLEPVLCDSGRTAQLLRPYSNGLRTNKKIDSNEDCDVLTDLFASVFNSHCSVLVVIHSHLQFDGTPLSSDQSYLVCVVKDNQLKAFFIRTIDLTAREMIAEKKITKSFEYDMPSEFVLTFLSEHGITCIGFKSESERDMFTRHVDRIVQLQHERMIKWRGPTDPDKSTDECIERKSPTEMARPVRAEEFDIYNLSPEWKYLFDQAGVSLTMLENNSTLQFILDKVYEMGGAPQKFQTIQETSNGSSSVREERAAAIAMDSALRHESIRASRLADTLRQHSVGGDLPQPLPRKFHPPTCVYSGVCSRYKDVLLRRTSLSVLAPDRLNCYCTHCVAGKPLVAVSGSPPHQYTLPVGWCQFILRSQSHSLAQRFCADWHVAFASVPPTHVAEIIRTGHSSHRQLSERGGVGNEITLSPDIKWSKLTANLIPEHYYDDVEKADFRVSTAFQLFVQPGSYSVTLSNDLSNPLQQIWRAPDRTYIPYALLVHVQQL